MDGNCPPSPRPWRVEIREIPKLAQRRELNEVFGRTARLNEDGRRGPAALRLLDGSTGGSISAEAAGIGFRALERAVAYARASSSTTDRPEPSDAPASADLTAS
jgi:alkylation response protein AidB-like acyl-CoA dehydrogenase